MKVTIKEHIKQLDVSSGGGFVFEDSRVNTIDNPMLVIGIGGTGIDALLRLKYQVNRKFKLPKDPITKKYKEKPDNIEFLALETNDFDLMKNYKEIGLDPIKEFVPLSNPGIGGVLQNRSKLEPHIKSWLAPDLSITDGMSGASGVRQAGRLLLFTRINNVVDTIERKIDTLLQGTKETLYVYLLTGLSGGTGSGCYLDIAYITRGIMESRFGPEGVNRVSMLGYLFTPDVNLSKRGLGVHTKEYIKKNGYAALKELDYWMNCDDRNERFNIKYGNRLTVNSPMPPFNLCHLISATNVDGKILDDGYDYAMNVAAENITNFMANEDKKGDEFAIHDYISNIRTNIAQMEKMYSANYKYTIIGASFAEIPMEELTTYVAYKLFGKMNNMFQATPNQTDVNQVARKLRIDPDSLQSRFKGRVPEPISGYKNSKRFSYDHVIKKGITNLDRVLKEEYLSKVQDQIDKCKNTLPDEILNDFRNQIDQMFTHPQMGPIYASRLIYTNDDSCLLTTIEDYIKTLRDKLDELPSTVRDRLHEASSIRQEASSTIWSREKKKNEYIDVKIEEYITRADHLQTEAMIEIYEKVKAGFGNQNSKIYEVYKEILEKLNEIFQDNANILINHEEIKEGSDKTYYWQIVSVPDIVLEIDRVFEPKNSDRLVQEWSEMLLKESSKWINENEVNVVKTISDFLRDKFGNLISQSMEDFLRMKHSDDKPIDVIIEQMIAGRLDRDAKPVFHLENSAGSLNFPKYGLVSVPAQAPSIYKGIENYQRNAVGHTSFTIQESELKNRIFWLNTYNGVPLYAFAPLRLFEESYEKSILEREGIGRHLVQTKEENWAFLPSPIPEKSWGDTYHNERLSQYNGSLKNLFDQAVQYGCIYEQENENNTGARFLCKVTKPISISHIFAEYDIDSNNIQAASLGNVKKCLVKLKDLYSGAMETEEIKYIFDSTSLEQAVENFIRSPKQIEQMREEVKKYTLLLEKINSLEDFINNHAEKQNAINQLVEALYTKTIRKQGGYYVYDKDPGEDPWEPIINVTKTPKFLDYELYKALTNLDQKRMDQLLKKAENRSEELLHHNTSEVIAALQEMAVTYENQKEFLDYERKEFINGEELYDFYKELKMKVNDILTSLN